MTDVRATDSDLVVHLPAVEAGCDQDAEWCEIETPEGRRRIRFHDYAEIYEIPGLYERLFYEELDCRSPRVVRELLEDVLTERDTDPASLVVLDVGAGNGMVGEELDDLGVAAITGIDILPEAAAAAERDRPDVYDDYRVIDLTDPPAADHEALSDAGFTCLTSVAALGFGDIPPAAFAQAFEYVEEGGLVAFTLKERFTRPDADETGFSRLVRRMDEEGLIEPLVEHRYRHRLSVAGEPLHYVAYVAEKRGDGPVPTLE